MRASKGPAANSTNALPSGASSLEQTAERASDKVDTTDMTAAGEETPVTEEKGESGRTHRDMQAVTDHYDERPTIDIGRIEKVSPVWPRAPLTKGVGH